MQAVGDADTHGELIPQAIDRLDSVEVRMATLESQQNWLRLEQLRAEVAGLRQTMDWLIQYVAARDGAAIVRGE